MLAYNNDRSSTHTIGKERVMNKYTGEDDREYMIDRLEWALTSGAVHSENEREFFRREISLLTKKELRQIINPDGSLNPVAWYIYNNLKQNYHAEISDDPSWRTINPIEAVLKRDRMKGSGL
jgi:hypothetical protein